MILFSMENFKQRMPQEVDNTVPNWSALQGELDGTQITCPWIFNFNVAKLFVVSRYS